MFSSVVSFVMKPQILFLQLKGEKISRKKPCYGVVLISLRKSMQLLTGIRAPPDSVSIVHAH